MATPGSGCAGSAASTLPATTSYVYDGGHSASSRSRGQLTRVSYADGSYSKALAYNARGQLASATVSIGGAAQTYTSSYGYVGYDRPQTTTWPDGDGRREQGTATTLPTWLFDSG